MSEPVDQVCGINGVTYDSVCAAIYCAGLAPFDFFRGACADVVGKIIPMIHNFSCDYGCNNYVRGIPIPMECVCGQTMKT